MSFITFHNLSVISNRCRRCRRFKAFCGDIIVSFSAVAVGMALEGIGDKIGEFLAS